MAALQTYRPERAITRSAVDDETFSSVYTAPRTDALTRTAEIAAALRTIDLSGTPNLIVGVGAAAKMLPAVLTMPSTATATAHIGREEVTFTRVCEGTGVLLVPAALEEGGVDPRWLLTLSGYAAGVQRVVAVDDRDAVAPGRHPGQVHPFAVRVRAHTHTATLPDLPPPMLLDGLAACAVADAARHATRACVAVRVLAPVHALASVEAAEKVLQALSRACVEAGVALPTGVLRSGKELADAFAPAARRLRAAPGASVHASMFL